MLVNSTHYLPEILLIATAEVCSRAAVFLQTLKQALAEDLSLLHSPSAAGLAQPQSSMGFPWGL